MLRATFGLALPLLAPPPQPAQASEAPAATEPATSGASREAPAPGASSAGATGGASPQAAPGAPAAAGGDPGDLQGRPKWWGPYPRPKVTGFGGPVVQLTGLDRSFAAMVGLAGGLTIRRRVSLGAAWMWLLNPIDAGTTPVGAPRRLNINFGSLLLSVVFARTQRVDFAVEGLIGGGGACLQNPETGVCYARTTMFVGQPGLAAHITLAPIVRIALGLGYRLVAARAWSGPDSGRLGAPVGSVMLEFGLF